MENYSSNWKTEVNFKQIDYNDFISEFKESLFYFSKKVDGRLGCLVFNRKTNECFFLSTNNIKIENIPVLEEYKNILSKENYIESCVIVGELSAVKNNKILNFSETESILKTHKYSKNRDLIHHFVYDIYFLNDKKISFLNSLKLLKIIFSDEKSLSQIHILDQFKGDYKILQKMWTKYVNKEPGIEGIVARFQSGKAFKIKPSLSFDLAVIGVGNKKMKAWGKNQISYLITAFLDKSGNFRRSSNVGTGFSNRERDYFFQYAEKNKILELENGEILIKPKQIIEATFQNFNIKEMPYIIFKEKNNSFEISPIKKYSVTMRFPSFLRIRTDKKIDLLDIGLRQIPEFPIILELNREIEKKIKFFINKNMGIL